MGLHAGQQAGRRLWWGTPVRTFPFVLRFRSRSLAWVGVFAAVLAVAAPAAAWARSSGGYSRPGGSSGRTPSFGGGGSYRTPSTSGGYSRPSESYAPSYRAPQSAGDRSFSEERSGSAFDSYRRQQESPRTPSFDTSRPPTPQLPRHWGPQPRTPDGRYASWDTAPSVPGWYGNRGWASPVPGYFGAGRSFGSWDGFFLGMLLSNLSRPGNVDWFHNNQDDPGYRQWRAEADRAAAENAELRARLDELDRRLAEKSGDARTPGTLPPEVPAEVAGAAPTRTPSTGVPGPGGHGNLVWVLAVVGAGAGGIGYLAWQRRPAGATGVSSPPDTKIGAAGAMLRHKLSGEAYRPDKFRVGMTIALDPTPFILAGEHIKLQQPAGTGSGQVSVSAVGQVTSGNTRLTRLYLADERSMVQLHLDAAGDPDECRLFGVIDEVTPTDPGEWAAWLDPKEGMIGWTQFQTKDGRTYDRVWAPGASMVSPRVISETIESLAGTRVVTSRAMLYAAASGVADPGPATEYVLVEARQDGSRAWVEVRSGIDLNPVTLQLA